MVGEILRVLFAALRVERVRRRMGPREALKAVREGGVRKARREGAARLRLKRAVSLVDRLFITGPNCYRRALLESALDMGAAAEPLMMGLRPADGACTGHAWLGSDPCASDYEVVVLA